MFTAKTRCYVSAKGFVGNSADFPKKSILGYADLTNCTGNSLDITTL